jgi:DNA-binding IclR family transcriptional regulator
MVMDNKYQVQSITRAFHILEQFSLQEDELSITEIKTRVNLPFSTVHRLLSSLEFLGYVSQNEKSGKYRLGYRAFILGSKVKPLNEIRSIVRVFLRDIFEKYNETVNFAIEFESKILCVETIGAQRRLIYTPGVGETHHLHATSVGKCILAFYEEEKRNRILSDLSFVVLTPNTITDVQKFRAELNKVREQGYATDNEESEIGLFCIGVPVLDSKTNCVGAVSLSIPVARMTHDIPTLIRDLEETSAQIAQATDKR